MINQVQVSIGKEKYTTEVVVNHHQLIVDEPPELNGADQGPTPTNLLLASLGSCKVITMRMYADQKQWPIERIAIQLTSETVKEGIGQTTTIQCAIEITADLDDMQKERLHKISEKCPIQKMLSNPIHIETTMK